MGERYKTLPEEEKAAFLKTALRVQSKPPCVNWMLMVLINVNPAHYLFDKNYVRPRHAKKSSQMKAGAMVPNINGFFDNIPMPFGAHKGRHISMATKEQKA